MHIKYKLLYLEAFLRYTVFQNKFRQYSFESLKASVTRSYVIILITKDLNLRLTRLQKDPLWDQLGDRYTTSNQNKKTSTSTSYFRKVKRSPGNFSERLLPATVRIEPLA